MKGEISLNFLGEITQNRHSAMRGFYAFFRCSDSLLTYYLSSFSHVLGGFVV